MRSLATALLIFLMTVAPSAAAKRTHHRGIGTYPSISELQNNLNLRPGTVLPRAIFHEGRIFQVFYVTAVAKPGGAYVITLRLVQ